MIINKYLITDEIIDTFKKIVSGPFKTGEHSYEYKIDINNDTL